MPLKLNSANGSITISAEDGSGNANITLPRAGIGSVSSLSDLSITATAAELNYVDGVTSAIQTQIDTKAPLASPALTGTPTAPTATAGDSSTKIATTAFVNTEVSNLVDSAPSTLNTLNELAAALGDDANFSTTVTNSIAAKAPLASPTFSGTVSDGDGAIRAIPQSGSDKTSSYTLTTGDIGNFVGVGSSGSITVPNSTFAAGDAISIFNNTTGDITITLSITTAYIAGEDADKNSVTLATRGVCTILFISGTVCVLSGNVS
jgi:hypothetical protein